MHYELLSVEPMFTPNLTQFMVQYRDARAIAGQGGQQERKGTEDHIQQIFIILYLNHVLLILLGTGFVLIRE